MSCRLACLWIPLFPLAARLRHEPELGAGALVILHGEGNRAQIVAANRVARAAGLTTGMTLPQARALCPALLMRARDGECERRAQEALIENAAAFSPRVEDAGEGTVYLDIDGLERHFRAARGGLAVDPERRLAEALLQATAKAGLPAQVGIAASKLTAWVAAGLRPSPVVIAAGEETAFLSRLSLTRIFLSADTTEDTHEDFLRSTLERWGLRTIGDLQRLPQDEVASRLGPAGQRLHARARGLDPRPLIPAPAPLVIEEKVDLEWPLLTLDQFLFIAHPALGRIVQQLEGRGLGCARLGLQLRLEPEGLVERLLVLPAPTRDAKTLLTLLRLDLEAHPPGAPVSGFALTAHPDSPPAAQLSLLGPAELSPDRLATTLARLFTVSGAGHIGSPRTVDGHCPERLAVAPYTPPPPPRLLVKPQPGRALLASRVLRPPIPLEVCVEKVRPVRVKSMIHGESTRGLRIDGAVLTASGPWGLEEGWWSENSIERDYWDVELSDRAVYRIFRDRKSGAWFADGIYG